jgi:hypothetical protein
LRNVFYKNSLLLSVNFVSTEIAHLGLRRNVKWLNLYFCLKFDLGVFRFRCAFWEKQHVRRGGGVILRRLAAYWRPMNKVPLLTRPDTVPEPESVALVPLGMVTFVKEEPAGTMVVLLPVAYLRNLVRQMEKIYNQLNS